MLEILPKAEPMNEARGGVFICFLSSRLLANAFQLSALAGCAEQAIELSSCGLLMFDIRLH